MIELTRLDGTAVWLNPDLLQWIDAKPDTRVKLTTGVTLIVLEEPMVIAQRVAQYRHALYQARMSPESAFKLIRMPEDA